MVAGMAVMMVGLRDQTMVGLLERLRVDMMVL